MELKKIGRKFTANQVARVLHQEKPIIAVLFSTLLLPQLLYYSDSRACGSYNNTVLVIIILEKLTTT